MKLTTLPNKSIATEPFPTTAVEKEIKGGFAMAKQKSSLYALKVVYGDDEYSILAGATVYLRGDALGHAWVKQVYEIGDQKFIIVPIAHVALVERERYDIWEATGTPESSACPVPLPAE